jgi:DNA-binding NarL/FixJ family response regulator
MDEKLRVLIADDHPLSRAGLRQVIESKSDYEVIAEAADGESALENIRKLQPEIAVLDISMPNMDGLAVAHALQKESSAVKIVFLTMYREQKMFDRAIEVGARGYVLKESAAHDIVSCLNAVAAGQHYMSPELTTYLIKRTQKSSATDRQGIKVLSPTERRVLRLLADYKTSKQIANELFISRRTVENHRSNICQKLDIHGSHALMKFALEHKDSLLDDNSPHN